MSKARTTKIISALATVPVLAAAFLTPGEVQAAAGGIQNCTVATTCTVGEFLYDDNSVALTGATCILTSKYPDGSAHLTSQAMTGQSDGWYSYEFTAPATTGLYRATVSCTASGDTTTIDRSFQVNAAPTTDTNSIASAVWSYSGRTVTSFGSLIADIWASATRTLTGTSLSSGNLATQDDVVSVRNQVNNLTSTTGDITNITNKTNEIRLLIEEVVNKPIIENVLEESVPDLTGKIQNTRASANQIYVNTQYLTSQSAALGSSWKTKDGKDLLAGIIEISGILGEEGDPSSSDTVFGQANWIKDSWNWDEADAVYTQLVTTKKIVETLKEGLADYKKDPALYAQAKALVKSFVALEKVVGNTSDTLAKKTLFAKVKTTESLAQNLDEKGKEVDKVLGAFVKSNDTNLALPKVTDLKNQVIALNKVPGVLGAISKVNPNDTTSIKNALFGLRGVINANKKLLASGAGKTLVNTWLEIGSIVFKTVVTNPSKLISQEVDVKYYLPAEIKKDDIIKTDPSLSVEYDSEKDQLYVTGVVSLAVGQTKTFSVETKDIWEYSQTGLNSLKDEVKELYKPLEKTAYFAQGVTLRSDINATLDKIAEIQAAAVTPEDKIKAYRESKILMESVDQKIIGMRDLVTQAGAAGNLFGFVGGAQTIAVWGLVIIIAAGFIFMTVYMKVVTSKAQAEVAPPKAEKTVHPGKLVVTMLISSVLSASVTGLVVSNVLSRNYEQKISVLGEKTTDLEFGPAIKETQPSVQDVMPSENLGTGGTYLVIVTETPTGYLRVRETPRGKEIGRVKPEDKLPFLDENENWYQVELETGEIGWVSKEYSYKE